MNAIVTTTINKPTEAIDKFVSYAIQHGWKLIIVGDKKTPHEEYFRLERRHGSFVQYLAPRDQELISQELSDLIGWNCIQRRNFGFIQALRDGANIVATVDDDNIPIDGLWGEQVFVNRSLDIDVFEPENEKVFDPLAVFGLPFWHRGYPIELSQKRRARKREKFERRKILVQADLWNGDPDVDAIGRITFAPMVDFTGEVAAYGGSVMGPFNSQNTFLSSELFPFYFLFPHIGRMDDIWASYLVQAMFPDSVMYGHATVFQKRNEHRLSKDLEAELIGYHSTLDFIDRVLDHGKGDWRELLPERSIQAYETYKNVINGL